MKTVIITDGQSLIDIALQEFGAADGVFKILQLNPGVNFTDDLYPGQKLYLEGVVIDVTTVKSYKSKGYGPATAGGMSEAPLPDPVENGLYVEINGVDNYSITLPPGSTFLLPPAQVIDQDENVIAELEPEDVFNVIVVSAIHGGFPGSTYTDSIIAPEP